MIDWSKLIDDLIAEDETVTIKDYLDAKREIEGVRSMPDGLQSE
jgi:hypothetical protein